MRRVLLVSVCLLGLAPAAAARHRPDPEPWRVRLLARDLERATARVFQQIERREHHTWRHEQRAIQRLSELAEAARHFQQRLDRHHSQPRDVRRSFHRLVRAYRRAEESVHQLHTGPRVHRAFRQVDHLMQRLEEAYTASLQRAGVRGLSPHPKGTEVRVEHVGGRSRTNCPQCDALAKPPGRSWR